MVLPLNPTADVVASSAMKDSVFFFMTVFLYDAY